MRFFLLLWAAMLLLSSQVFAGTKSDYESFFDSKVVVILNTGKNSSAKNVREIMASAFADTMDSDYVARFLIGKGWKTTPKDIQSRFIKAYTNYLASRYLATVDSSAISGVEFGGIEDIVETDKYVDKYIKAIVRRSSVDKNNNASTVKFRVRKTKPAGEIKGIDIVTQDISILKAQRDEFQVIFAERGIDGVIEFLERHI